ncbi:MAG: hypothetical protein KAT46_04695 [Deltaproteobacteria bacterium]|nr:hypothetical protein [Deltaproteobacteria bacterium]
MTKYFIAVITGSLVTVGILITLNALTPFGQGSLERLESLAGTRELILAKERVYHEYEVIKTSPIGSTATVLIRWIADYEYFLDIKNEPLKIIKKKGKLHVIAPPIRLKQIPSIDTKTLRPITLDGAFFLNEEKLMLEEIKNITFKTVKGGQEHLKSKRVKDLVTRELKEFLRDISTGLGKNIQEIRIEFKSVPLIITKQKNVQELLPTTIITPISNSTGL